MMAFVLVSFMPISVFAVGAGESCQNAVCDSGLACNDDKVCVATDTFGIQSVDGEVSLGKEDIRITITKIISTALGLLGIMAVGIVLYGGFKWMTAGGNEEQVLDAKRLLINGLIGLVIIMSAWAIARFVLAKLSDATGSGSVPCIGEDCKKDEEQIKVVIPTGGDECAAENELFVLQSITPNQDETGMNNIVMRAIFSKDVQTPLEDIFVIEQDKNLKNKNSFTYKYADDAGQRIVEAVYKGDTSCAAGGKDCLPEGKTYTVKVHKNVKGPGGEALQNEKLKVTCPDTKIDTLVKDGATFKVDKKATDAQDPSIKVQILDQSGVVVASLGQKEPKVEAGKTYDVLITAFDDSGMGYIRTILTDHASKKILDKWSGPSSESDKVFQKTYSFTVGAAVEKGAAMNIEVEAFDIDHKKEEKQLTLSVVNDKSGGEGSYCKKILDCKLGLKCVANVCSASPYITNMDPDNGAPGNWITIAGQHFGEKPGKIQFSFDKNKNGQIDGADEWKDAKIVACNDKKPMWTDNFVIVEVPSDKDIGLEAFVKVITESGEEDTSGDDFGPLAAPFEKGDGVPNGVFKRNSTKRPGLCQVVAKKDLATQAKPEESIHTLGSGFGPKEQAGKILFGGKAFDGLHWNEVNVEIPVPTNLNPATVDVRVQAKNGEKSNGVLFTVLPGDADLELPIIDNIDPATSTVNSFVTITGRNFGDSGKIFLTLEKGGVCPGGGCMEIKTPAVCGNTWSDKQVVAEIPNVQTINFTKPYYVVIQNGKTKKSSNGQQSLRVIKGDPIPGLCSITPNKGPAPLPAGVDLVLKGNNFDKPTVYFYKKGADIKKVSEWFKQAVDKLKSASKTEIVTLLPLEKTGKSMPTGPIRVGVGSKLSNSVNYEVVDCTVDASGKPGEEYRCCSAEGPDKGLWKHTKNVCSGEVRDAGYVWRFTTGKFPEIPYVVEQTTCTPEKDANGKLKDVKELSSPSPWKEQTGGNAACLNTRIATRFTTNMDLSTLTKDTFVLYECGTKEEDCNDTEKKKKVDWKIDSNTKKEKIDVTNTSILGTPKELKPTTWYRVELSNKIQSNNTVKVAGENQVEKIPLGNTAGCGNGTAYCFTFKTGSASCAITGAYINPAEHITRTLGVVQHPGYPIDDNIEKPKYPLNYILTGTTDNSCVPIDVDGLGWKWTGQKGVAEVTEGFKDTRATVKALQHSEKAVTISSSLKKNAAKNIEKDITAKSLLHIDLLEPEVIFNEPECLGSCVNPQIRAVFNRHMDKSTYAKGFKMYTCTDASCEKRQVLKDAKVDEIASTATVIDIALNNALATSTYYQVVLDKNIRALSGSSKIVGKELKEKNWVFKTQDDPTPCTVSYMTLDPKDHVATQVGEKTIFTVNPYSSSNKCSAVGQPLDRWKFDYEWKTGDVDVATVSHFKNTPLSALNQSCSTSCLPRGSDILRTGTDNQKIVCGDGVVSKGEDCDIGIQGEIVGQSCTINCLRPGNNNIDKANTCGDKNIDKQFGEECDPGKDKEGNVITDDPACTSLCQHRGSTPFDGSAKANCGDGITDKAKGEECDPGSDKNKKVKTDDPFCTSSCLKRGTDLAAAWCDVQKNKPAECKAAKSVCGNLPNSVLELDEECEIEFDPADKKWGLRIRGVPGLYQKHETKKLAQLYCSNNCRLINLCELQNKLPNNVPNDLNGWWCQAGQEGCTDSCKIAGASPEYSEPSICGDAVKGTGEYGACELEKADVNPNDGPAQVVTAVGKKKTQGNAQKTFIQATLSSNKNIIAKADYALQCGFTEYVEVSVGKKFNDCPNGTDGVSSSDSCCYPRPKRSLVYPKDGSGLTDQNNICRNTSIHVEYDKEISLESVKKNAMLLRGYKAPYACDNTKGEKDVSKEVGTYLAYDTSNEPSGWFEKIWFSIKKFLVSVFKVDSLAINFNVTTYIKDVEKISVWCEIGGGLKPSVDVQKDAQGKVVKSTVHLSLTNVLGADSVYAVMLKSGPDGVQDTNGVSIANPDVLLLRDDMWAFKTGKDICKLEKVDVQPNLYLFNKPETSHNFQAVAYGKNNVLLTPTPAYKWDWDWQPKENPVFDIPAKGSATSTSGVTIASKNVQGTLAAFATARVTADVSANNNQVGKIFSGISELTSQFCETPWPAYQKDGTWKPYNDAKFNFSFKYCSDAGKTGVTTDDLPFLKKVVPDSKRCSVTGAFCKVDSDCEIAPAYPTDTYTLIQTPSGGYDFKELKDVGALCFGRVKPKQYIACKTALDCPADYPVCGWSDNGCVKYNVPPKPIPAPNNNACTTKEYPDAFKSSTFIDHAKVKQTCEGKEPVFDKKDSLTQPIEKLLFFDEHGKNSDAIGVQIFDNNGTTGDGNKRLTALQWYTKRFPDAPAPQKVSSGNYDAVTDGNNYYINALNIVKNPQSGTKVFSNIYVFSISEGAQENTKKVFEEVLQSLTFNTNLTDYGYCIDSAIDPAKVDFTEEVTEGKKYAYSKVTCSTDFDCADKSGKPLKGTNGICSNAKTKFLRDWQRLGHIKDAQTKIKAYQDKIENKTFPELKGGSFIPGYSTSKWSSWGTLSSIVGGLNTDPINQWTQCDGADPQTCWNSGQSQYLCPLKSSVYEYIYKPPTPDGKVASTGEYTIHVPLEYFQDKSQLWVEFGKDFILSDASLGITQFCTPSTTYSPFSGSCGDGVVQPTEQCDPVGGTKIVDSSLCKDLKQGDSCVATCTNQCTWEYKPEFFSLCNEKLTGQQICCGNGIVQGNESCDDGPLNGTYGHCNVYCKAPSPQYCGNNKRDYIDANKNNKYDPGENNQGETYLELCDPSAGDWDLYNIDEKKSCSPTCQGPGLFCGDEIVSNGEQCDDGNNISKDGCSSTCKKENIACMKKLPQYLYNSVNGNTKILITRIDKKAYEEQVKNFAEKKFKVDAKFVPGTTHIDECFEMTGDAICSAATGDKCLSVQGDGKQKFENYDCNKVINKKFAPNIENPKDIRFIVTCKGEYSGDVLDDQKKVEVGCGNLKVENSETTPGTDLEEVCDEGTKNGIKCTPGYGEACTYCAADCKKVLTVDPVAYCGNQAIDVNHGEKCEFEGTVDKQTTVYKTNIGKPGNREEIACDDAGRYECLKQCTVLSKQCVTCGLVKKKTEARVALINPMKQDFSTNDVPGLPATIALVRKDSPNTKEDYELLKWRVMSASKDKKDEFKLNTSFTFVAPFEKDKIGTIETSLLCDKDANGNGGYGVVLGGGIGGKTGIYDNKGLSEKLKAGAVDFFEYPVSGELGFVKHEYVYSPPVPENVFRVVVKWTDKENKKGLKFQGNVQNPWVNSGKVVNYLSSFNKDDKLSYICSTGRDFAKDCPDRHRNKVYIHPYVNGETIFTQSFTIDASQSVGSYRFFVDSLTGPIGLNTNTELTVEVYEHRKGQDDEYSILKPAKVFSLAAAADTSSNKLAKYWHVFNIVNDGKSYQVESVQDEQGAVQPNGSIETNFDTLKKNTIADSPDAPPGYSLLSFSEKKAKNFFVEENPPATFNPKGIMSAFRTNAKWYKKGDDGFIFDSHIAKENSVLQTTDCGSVADCTKVVDGKNNYRGINSGKKNNKGATLRLVGNATEMEESKIYQYVVDYSPQQKKQNGEYDFPFLKDFITKNPTFSMDVRIGVADQKDKNKFVMSNVVGRLNKKDLNKISTTAKKWYVYKAVRIGKNIFIDVIDKYMLGGAKPPYAQYE